MNVAQELSLGLMAAGRLIALDTPAALKRTYVPGRIYLARGRELGPAAAVLRGQPGVTAVEPFGAGLHLQVDPALWDKVRLAAAPVGDRGHVVRDYQPERHHGERPPDDQRGQLVGRVIDS